VGLEPHRGDDTVQSAQILEQVLRYLERSRFVVAKIDVEKLNVYFELGLAMGLDKDVLLIFESSLMVTLPSDLRNWECLTYEKGNYEQPRERVSAFFETQYHMDRREAAT
jgi:predicted nucleotide-binding protein